MKKTILALTALAAVGLTGTAEAANCKGGNKLFQGVWAYSDYDPAFPRADDTNIYMLAFNTKGQVEIGTGFDASTAKPGLEFTAGRFKVSKDCKVTGTLTIKIFGIQKAVKTSVTGTLDTNKWTMTLTPKGDTPFTVYRQWR